MRESPESKLLPVAEATAAAGVPGVMWVLDAARKELVRFSASDAAVLDRLVLDATPRCLAASDRLLALGAEGRTLRALDPQSGKERFRAGLGADPIAVRVRGDTAWVVGADGAIARVTGPMPQRFSLRDATAIAPARDDPADPSGLAPGSAFVLVENGGALVRVRRDGTEEIRVEVPPQAQPVLAIAFCANALWVTAPSGLHLFEPIGLSLRASFPSDKVPASPTTQMVCDGWARLFGAGERGVFLMDPAADEMFRALPIAPASPLCAIAISGETLWAIESAAPAAHIIDVP